MKKFAAILRRIIGAPDYSAYIAHCSAQHPDRKPLGEREFLAERWKAKYETPGGKCC